MQLLEKKFYSEREGDGKHSQSITKNATLERVTRNARLGIKRLEILYLFSNRFCS
jgi:hypothetical protein